MLKSGYQRQGLFINFSHHFPVTTYLHDLLALQIRPTRKPHILFTSSQAMYSGSLNIAIAPPHFLSALHTLPAFAVMSDSHTQPKGF